MSIKLAMSHQVEELSRIAMSHQIEELSAEELDAVVGASGGYHYTPNTPPNPPPSRAAFATQRRRGWQRDAYTEQGRAGGRG